MKHFKEKEIYVPKELRDAGWIFDESTQRLINSKPPAQKEEPFLMDQQQFQELTHDEKDEYRAQFKQSPSIKRPTEDKIEDAAWSYAKKQMCADKEQEDFAYNDFKAGINWFLSIQPDK